MKVLTYGARCPKTGLNLLGLVHSIFLLIYLDGILMDVLAQCENFLTAFFQMGGVHCARAKIRHRNTLAEELFGPAC